MSHSFGTLSVSQQKAQSRKLAVQEDSLKSKQSAMMVKKTRGSLLVGLCMIVGISCLNSHFYGQIAGRLPF